MITADTLHRHNQAVPESLHGIGEFGADLAKRGTSSVGKAKGRAARRTADRLGMKSPIGGVLVLGATGVAHRETGHRCVGPVVGQRSHDGEARPTVRAVHKGVREPAIGRVGLFSQAVGTRSNIGRNAGGRLVR